MVTPSYDQAPFLRQTIESVLGQDYPNLEYFVADGGSTDGSRQILESYGERLRWVSAPDGGQAAAIGAAWQETDAEIVAWLNSDDTYLDGAITAAVEHLRSHPRAAMVYGEAWHVDESGVRIGKYPTRHPLRRETLAANCYVCQPTVFLRREVFRVVDLPDPELRCALDYDLWIRVSELFEASYLDRELATSRLHPCAKTVAERDRVYDEIVAVTRCHFGRVDDEWVTGFLHHRLRRPLGRAVGFLPLPVRRALFAGLARRPEPRPAPPYPDGWIGRERRCVSIQERTAGWRSPRTVRGGPTPGLWSSPHPSVVGEWRAGASRRGVRSCCAFGRPATNAACRRAPVGESYVRAERRRRSAGSPRAVVFDCAIQAWLGRGSDEPARASRS